MLIFDDRLASRELRMLMVSVIKFSLKNWKYTYKLHMFIKSKLLISDHHHYMEDVSQDKIRKPIQHLLPSICRNRTSLTTSLFCHVMPGSSPRSPANQIWSPFHSNISLLSNLTGPHFRSEIFSLIRELIKSLTADSFTILQFYRFRFRFKESTK